MSKHSVATVKPKRNRVYSLSELMGCLCSKKKKNELVDEAEEQPKYSWYYIIMIPPYSFKIGCGILQ